MKTHHELTRSPAAPAEAPGAAAGAPLFGREQALAMIGDDRELLDDLVGISVAELPRQLGDLRAALAAGDATTARRHAHTMKGTAATLCAEPVRLAALAVEHAARDGDMAGATRLCGELESLAGSLLAELERHLAAR